MVPLLQCSMHPVQMYLPSCNWCIDILLKGFFCLWSLIEEGGDWDRRNRLKVYQGLYCVAIRDFKQAAELFLDTVSTFTSYELMDYKTFVTYTVYVSMIALDRPDLREKVRSTVMLKYTAWLHYRGMTSKRSELIIEMCTGSSANLLYFSFSISDAVAH